MEKKKENFISMANLRFSDENPSAAAAAAAAEATSFGGSIFDMPTGAGACDGDNKWGSSLGFMDLLGIHQDFIAPSLFDSFQPPSILPPPPPSTSSEPLLHQQLDTKQLQALPSPASTVPESSEVLNNPATPNSSSFSSSSNEAANDHEPTKAEDDEEEEQDQDKTKKHITSSGSSFNASIPDFIQDRRFNTPTSSSASLPRDHGLLQDIVPTQMRKEAKEQ
ncbi:hypothetical protein J1N35_037035 [Gossypium stocksii]|uniref:Uncharacterized protein n=1 Tax=Gossypium stocksii TaxID=47602 RepID=A0A9D3UIX8_9ROSI|nr:hypothetical protein J1N35_037035 [Gossypium stocksii]